MDICTYAHMRICTYAYMHIYTYAQMCTDAHMHICTYAHMHIPLPTFSYNDSQRELRLVWEHSDSRSIHVLVSIRCQRGPRLVGASPGFPLTPPQRYHLKVHRCQLLASPTGHNTDPKRPHHVPPSRTIRAAASGVHTAGLDEGVGGGCVRGGGGGDGEGDLDVQLARRHWWVWLGLVSETARNILIAADIGNS